MDDLLNDPRAGAIGAACLVGLILGAIGVAIVLVVAYQRQRVARSQQWPSTLGTVLASGVREHGGDDGHYYVPDVTYQYTVAGQTYRGNRVTFGPSGPT